MNEQRKDDIAKTGHPDRNVVAKERAMWQRPELRRLDMSETQTTSVSFGTDTVFS